MATSVVKPKAIRRLLGRDKPSKFRHSARVPARANAAHGQPNAGVDVEVVGGTLYGEELPRDAVSGACSHRPSLDWDGSR
jgi:hypothetical protein